MSGAVITGGAKGMGKCFAQVLVNRGYKVLIADVDIDGAEETAAELGNGTIAMQVDVRDEEQLQACCDRIIEEAGGLDVWVNNAGVLRAGFTWEQDKKTRDFMMDINATGLMNGTVVAVRAMIKGGGGHIIEVVSSAGLIAGPGEGAYIASKHAAMGFSLSTVSDLEVAGIKNIKISCLCPDGIWTPMLYNVADDPDYAMSFYHGHLTAPEEVAWHFDKLLDKPRLVWVVPRSRRFQLRFGDLVPWLNSKLAPTLVRNGIKEQKKVSAYLHSGKDPAELLLKRDAGKKYNR